MLTENDLRELLAFSAPEPVISVYLNTDPAEGNADVYKLRLRNMLKEVNSPEDVQAIERYFAHGFDWSGRSVAVFSCASRNFFRAYPLGVPTPDRIRVDTRPTVKPLAALLDAYGGYGVILVDKQGARAFYIQLGELSEQEGILGESVKHTKRGGASAVPGRRGGVAGQTRYEDELVDRNMKDVVDFAVHFFEQNRIRRILVGGTDDNVALFRSVLPKAWQSLVMGTFPMSMIATSAEVVEKAMQVGVEAEHRREEQLIDTLITAAAKGNGGVLSLENTLQALHDGRVQTLLISDGYREAGFQCSGCGFLTTHEQEQCPFCGAHFEKINDAVEMAVRAVMQNGGEIEIIHDAPALNDAGRIGAILRY